MHLEYLIPLLAMLGVAHAHVKAKFAYEVDCGTPIKAFVPWAIRDSGCITQALNAKSFSMDLTKKHRTICLKKYAGESCKGEPVGQEYSWDKANFTCVNIEMTSTLQFGSYKFNLNGC